MTFRHHSNLTISSIINTPEIEYVIELTRDISPTGGWGDISIDLIYKDTEESEGYHGILSKMSEDQLLHTEQFLSQALTLVKQRLDKLQQNGK